MMVVFAVKIRLFGGKLPHIALNFRPEGVRMAFPELSEAWGRQGGMSAAVRQAPGVCLSVPAA